MVTLHRLVTSLLGTRGVILHDKKVICHTLELPWFNNVQNQSCIPAGEYLTNKTHSSKFGNCFFLNNVPNRLGILIHAGNGLSDTRGCILVGLDVLDNGISHSRLALSRLLASLPDTFTLKIKENY